MEKLVGRRIDRVRVSQDQTILCFETDAGPISFEAEGDCCSESWFADITGVLALIGGTVRDVLEVDMEGYNVRDGRGRQCEDEAYGYKLATDKGYADIVFRNSSNGFYGGTLRDFRRELPAGMTDILDDWSA